MDGKCLVADSNCDTVDLQCPVFFCKGWQIMVDSHLVLVTLGGRVYN